MDDEIVKTPTTHLEKVGFHTVHNNTTPSEGLSSAYDENHETVKEYTPTTEENHDSGTSRTKSG